MLPTVFLVWSGELFFLVYLMYSAIGVAVLFPETPIGKKFRWFLAEEPARRLSQLTPAKAITVVVLGLVVMLISFVVPLSLALIMAGDMAAYVEVLAAIGLVIAGVRARGALGQLVSIVARLSIIVGSRR